MKVIQTIGNKTLWKREKILFLTSRQTPVGCYESIFQWVEVFAQQVRGPQYDKFNSCAVCFNTSELEEEVLKALLVCKVPTVLVVTQSYQGFDHE